MSSSSWFERNKKVAIGVGVAAVVGAVAVGAYYLNKKSSRVPASSSDAPSHASLAMKHHKNGSHRESIQSWTDAIQEDPNNFKYYNNRAQSYMLVNEYEHALADADKAIALNGEAAGGYYNRGRAALKLERFEDAAAAFTAALRQVDASKIASQAQAMLKTCEEKIKKIRDSRFPSVAGAKKSSPVNSQRVSPSNKVSPTTSPVATKKHTEQVAHVASTILEHAKPPVVEPVKATLPTPAAAAATVTRTPSPAPAPTTTTPSPTPSTTQPDLSSSSKIADFLTEQRRIQAEIEQKQKAVEVADKIVDKVTHYVHTNATTTTTSVPAVSTASTAAPSTSTSTNTKTTSNTTAPVQIPSIFTPTSQNNKAESPVSPVSDTGSNSGIFERSAVYVPNDASAQTPPNKQSRLSFMTPDLISDTTTIDAESAVPIEAFAAIATGTPLETPPSVFRTISAENSASSSSNSTSASKSTSSSSSPILLNKPLPKQAPATVPNGPLNFASENPLEEM